MRDLRTKYSVKEPADLIEAQTIIEDGTSSIPRVVELTDQLAETEEKSLTHKKEHETVVARFNDLASELILLQ